MITADDFEAWLQNPVTLEVLAAVRKLAEGCKSEWLEMSWGGNIDPTALAALKAKEQLAGDLATMDYEDLTEWQAKE